MSEIKATAIVDGTEREVVLKEPPAGFLPESQFETRFSTELQRRTEGIRKNLRDELLKDQDFRSAAEKAWGVKPAGKDGGDNLNEQQVAALRQSWEKEHLTPILREKDEAASEVKSLRERQLESTILQTVAGKVKPWMVTAPTEDAAAPIVAMLRPLFEFDAQTKTWALRKGDSFEYSSKPSKGSPFKGPAEFLTEWLQRKENADFLLSTSQSGPNANVGGGSTGGVVKISRADARIRSKFEAAERQAKEAGAQLVIGD